MEQQCLSSFSFHQVFGAAAGEEPVGKASGSRAIAPRVYCSPGVLQQLCPPHPVTLTLDHSAHRFIATWNTDEVIKAVLPEGRLRQLTTSRVFIASEQSSWVSRLTFAISGYGKSLTQCLMAKDPIARARNLVSLMMPPLPFWHKP